MIDKNALLKIKRGYLNEDFKYFHLKDHKHMEFESHYHDFNKIIIFLSGNVNYLVEGKSYRLKPWDVILINSNEVHKPIINPEKPYERIIIWINKLFLEKHNTEDSNLLNCFKLSSSQKNNLLRLNKDNIEIIKSTLDSLENNYTSKEFGNHILKNSILIQLMVYINRLFLGNKLDLEKNDIQYDESIVEILQYINSHLSENLSIEIISSKFFINRYYLMHKFKEQTGYTIHNYIQQKRLLQASNLLKKGISMSTVCEECGFGDYSSFVRAFKKMFDLSPRNYYKVTRDLQNYYKINNHVH
ncbi:AraC family transcriptional regulator [Clostridium pasteurianum]|uniref:DNA-binding domain-containing protein, AraC-type n=1 Tax=Clostridium pasteurianum BC1 TaxID=86416 RepID=R4K9U0_CLOPA|nr:AraC family transcriptional regulator [Clostridium pasteurianum]AGK99338.1 DNA-binding domain-containing protein, AraC-type [Clostridium pasteurianum BC1]